MFFLVWNMQTHADNVACYAQQAVYNWDLQSDTSYIVQSPLSINEIQQWWTSLSFTPYKNVEAQSIYYKNYEVLNDKSLQTFLEIDTREKKEFLLEFQTPVEAQKFNFIANIESLYHDIELFISSNWVNYSQVTSQNIEDFSFQYFKINFAARTDIQEKIKIRELRFQRKMRSYVIHTSSSEEIQFYSEYICNTPPKPIKLEKINYTLSTKTQSFVISFRSNPKLSSSSNDSDKDFIIDSVDNCPNIYNPLQKDSNADGVWDKCADDDFDGIIWHKDNCISIANVNQTDVNQNDVWDVCEFDADSDWVFDSIDNCRNTPNPDQTDDDNDSIGNLCDNCRIFNPTQKDENQNSIGDTCEQLEEQKRKNDKDWDGVIDSRDNCKNISNPEQNDTDSDWVWDMCDNCKNIQNKNQLDVWIYGEEKIINGVGDICEDADNDGIVWYQDNCLSVANPDQADADNDGIGNLCEDNDKDWVLFLDDNCPYISNTNQSDLDNDGVWDMCDEMDDRLLESNKSAFMILLFWIVCLICSLMYYMYLQLNKNKDDTSDK